MIDIVVPIYNAYNDLIACLESLYKWTDFSLAKIILIDDHSSDPRIQELLKQQTEPHVKVIYASENLGFSETVNKGIMLSNNDVILLNSDTIVTKGWVQKLHKCAYSEKSIGTVTPLSNNASICSVPIFLERNELPIKMTVDEAASIVERISFKRYPSIPVAVGFCMYIKRTLIEDVGLFNGKLFGLGYGEENDFCYRSGQLGYKHVVCDDTYIYHNGGVSFSENSKKAQNRKNLLILTELYPDQEQNTQQFMLDNPLYDIQKNIEIYFKISNGKKNILQYLHNDFKKGTSNFLGGTQIHVQDIVEKTLSEYNHFVVSIDRGDFLLTAYVDEYTIPFRFKMPIMYNWHPFTDKSFSNIIENIINGFAIDLIHVHNISQHTFDIFYIAKERDIPIICSFHDYYFVCPNFTLLDMNGECCYGVPQTHTCKECMNKLCHAQVDILAKWRSEVPKVLLGCNKLVAPSNSTKEIISKIYPQLEGMFSIIPHGSNNPHKLSPNIKSDGKINVAFLGGVSLIKGSEIIYDMISKNRKPHIQWNIIGLVGDLKISLLEQKNLYKHGIYERKDVYNILNENNIDVICILSIVPETFCYTLSEAVESGIPVIVRDIGALGERVREMGCGWVVPIDSNADTVVQLIEFINQHPEEYQKKVNTIKQLPIRTIQEMANEYKLMYDQFLTDKKEAIEFDSNLIYSGFVYESNPYNENEIPRISHELKTVYDENQAIKNSFTYKIMQKIAKIPIPFKSKIKRFLVGFYRFFFSSNKN